MIKYTMLCGCTACAEGSAGAPPHILAVGEACTQHRVRGHDPLLRSPQDSAYMASQPATPTPTPGIATTVAERTAQYGDFRLQAQIAQALKETARQAHSWPRMRAYQREAVDMILHKIARIVCGNPDYADSWHDIQGYAKITEDRLPGANLGKTHCGDPTDRDTIQNTPR